MKSKMIFERHKVKSTKLRSQVLEIFLKYDKPLKAYEVLSELKKVHHSAEPPTIYRVLNFFVEHHILHRIQSTHAYAVCHIQPTTATDSNSKHIIMICKTCNNSKEVADLVMHSLIKKITTDSNFHFPNNNIELLGFCHGCYPA